MAATTTLLGLVTPTQGTLTGTWGDTVNYGISDYLDIAIAGTLSFAGDGAITLANTTGSSSGNSIGATTAQYMVIRVTGTQTITKIITGPSYSKLYMVDHAGATSAVTFKAAGQTGVSVAVGEKCFVYYNGTDYVKVASSVADGVTTIDFGSTGLTPNTATSGAVTVAGTLAVANGGTGVTTSTGTTNVVLSNNPTLVAPVLGTPASGTVTNLTGTASININGTVGATTATTGAFTTLSATGQITSTVTSASVTEAVSGNTNALYHHVKNTGGEFYIGLNNSSNAGLITGGGAYATCILNPGATNIAFGVNGTLRAILDTAGLAVTGTLSATGAGSIQGLTVGLGAGAVATNTAVGVSALAANTAGVLNTAVGYEALATNTDNSANTAVGYRALKTQGAGVYQNTAMGAEALTANITGVNNSAFGRSAMLKNTSGGNNVAVGFEALAENLSASANTAVGYQAGYTNTTGAQNTAVGYQALNANVTGNYNAAFGDRALRLATGSNNASFGGLSSYNVSTGANNTAVGSEALFSNTTASSNTAVGYQAGYTNITGTYNTFIGYQAGYTSNVGGGANGNTCVGTLAGYSLTVGADNTFIGPVSANAGYFVTSGSRNTIVGGYTGNNDGLDIRTADNYAVISDGLGRRQITMAEGQTLALDSAVPNSGTGITFPATENLSSNANTLDDYEEGTFTAGIAFGGAAVGVTYDTTPTCTYTKIGRQVTVTGRVGLSSKGSSTGDATITGLIFTPANTGNAGYGSCSIIMNSVTFANQYAANITPNSASIVLQENSLLGTYSAITDVDFSNSSNLLFTATYFV